MRAWPLFPLLVSLSLAGCATLPIDGPVRAADERSYTASAEEPAVRRLAPPPRAGAGPEEIVRGFLLASAGTEENSATARRYLTTAAAADWSPEGGVVILESYPELEATDSTVRLEGRQVGAIDEGHSYRAMEPAKPVSVTFGLRQDGRAREWRIASLPDGVFLPRYEVDRVYRSVDAYYLNAGQDRLVPEPLVVPATGSLGGLLIQRLLQGPGPALAPAVTNALPRNASLEDGTVPMRGGVAEVRLVVEDPPESPNREAMLAQVAYTLKQLPGVTAVRLTLNGDEVDVAGSNSPQPVDAWARFDPEVLQQSETRPYAVVAGRVGVLEEDGFAPLPGGAGSRRLALRTPAVTLDASQVAAVSEDGERLYSGRIGGVELPAVRLRGRFLGDPSFDAAGNLWVLDAGSRTSGADPALWLLPPGARGLRVPLPDLSGGRVREMRVSRDGLRIALIADTTSGDKLYLGVLLRSSTPAGLAVRVGEPTEVAPRFTVVRDVAWRDSRTLAVLAVEPGSVPQPYLLGIDGFFSEVLSPVPANAISITAAPGAPVLVGADDRLVYQGSGRTWRERGRASDPVYPG